MSPALSQLDPGGLPTLRAVLETLTLRGGYNTNLVIAGTTLLGLAAGIIGLFALLRKRSLMADTLSHATLPGIVLAFLVAGALGLEGRAVPVLLLGAALTGVLGVLSVQGILRGSRLREDAAMGMVLSVFFGAGVVGLSYIQANAAEGAAGLHALIFGQAAAMQPADVALMAAIAGTAIAATLLLLKELALVCFNDAFARVDGWPVGLIDAAMMLLVVLATIAGLQAVGLILVVALQIIPPVAARFWTERLWLLVVISGAIGAASGYIGSVISALLPRQPAGAVIVLTSGAIFAVSLIAAPNRGIIAASLRRLRLRLRIAGDHLLERAHELGVSTLPRAEVALLARTRGWPMPLRVVVVGWLRRRGMLAQAGGGGLRVTQAGRERGARVRRNHALWAQYLISRAEVAPSHVDWSVDQVEHVLSESLVRELEGELALRGIDVRHCTAGPS